MSSYPSVHRQLIYKLPIDGIDISDITHGDITINIQQYKQVKQSQHPTLNTEQFQSNQFVCTACDLVFDSADDQRFHSKSALHVHNVQLKSSNKQPVTQQQFQYKQNNNQHTDTDVYGDFSTDSDATDVDNDNSIEHSSAARLQFIDSTHHTQYTVWRNILVDTNHVSSILNENVELYMNKLHDLCTTSTHTICILMGMGGRFSGAIYKYQSNQPAAQCIQHKSFQRYTTRRKQGGSQFTQDASGKYASSAGATIRRAETKKYIELIHTTLQSWRDDIQQCNIIYIFAPSYNKNILFMPQSVLNRDDDRIRSIPFPVRRPTFAEVQRIYNIITTVEISQYTQQPNIQAEQVQSSDVNKQIDYMDIKSINTDELCESLNSVVVSDADQLLNAIERDDSAAVKQLYNSHYVRPTPVHMPALYYAVKHNNVEIVDILIDCMNNNPMNDVNDTSDDNNDAVSRTGIDVDVDIDECTMLQGTDDITVDSYNWTSLQRACYDSNDVLVQRLLYNGANPLLTDIHQRNAYALCRDKSTRVVIRKYAFDHPDEHNWSSAQIVPLSDQVDTQQKQRLAEQRKAKKARQKEKQRAEKLAQAELVAAQQQELHKQQLHLQSIQHKLQLQQQQSDELKLIERERDNRERSISDRERRAAAVERRLAAMSGKSNTINCSYCNKPITSTPYERFHYKYDTITCCQQHMKFINK